MPWLDLEKIGNYEIPTHMLHKPADLTIEKARNEIREWVNLLLLLYWNSNKEKLN